jgi:hypothetical protein
MEALERNPKLSLRDHRSVRYRDTAQLVQLGWMRTSDRYVEFMAQQATRRLRDGASA